MARIDLTSAGVKLFYAEEVVANVRPIDAENYHHIEGVKELPEMNAAPETLDSTTLDDEVFKASILGLHDLSGVLGFTFNFTQKFREDWQALYDLYVSLKEDNLGMWFAIQIPGVEKSLYFRGKPLHSNFNGISTNSVLEVSAYIMAESEPLWEDAPYTYTTILGQPYDQDPTYIYLMFSRNGKMFIDWDDGSPIEEFVLEYDEENDEGYLEIEHTFPDLADRNIKIRSTVPWWISWGGISELSPLEIRTDKMMPIVESGSFSSCYQLHTVIFAEETIELGNDLFEDCENITSVYIPKNVITIREGAFDGTSILEEITVDQKNKYFTSIDGILYSKDKTKLIACPKHKQFENSEFHIPESVRTIGARAFSSYDLEEITVYLPVNIRRIEQSAFGSSLISLGSSLYNIQYIGDYAFQSSLLSGYIEIPKSLSYIGDGAFAQTFLSEVDFLSEIERIPNYLFQGTTSLDYVSLPDSVKIIGMSSFRYTHVGAYGALELPQFLEVIEFAAYAETPVEEIIFPQTLKRIVNDAFMGCTNLGSIELNEGLEHIGGQAFRSTSIDNIIIPASVQTIEAGVFIRCKYLKNITSPFVGRDRERNIGRDATIGWWFYPDFGASDGMTAFTTYYKSQTTNTMVSETRFMPTGLESITITEPSEFKPGMFSAFTGAINIELLPGGDSSHSFYKCSGLQQIDLPIGMTIIKYRAFTASGLTSIVVPNTVTTIEEHTFNSCLNLVSAVLPDSLITLGNGAFWNCINLQSVVLGNSLQTIGYKAFGQTKISSIYLPDSIVLVDYEVFEKCMYLETINVPFLGKTSVSENIDNYRFKSLIWYFGNTAFTNSYDVLARISFSTTYTYMLPQSLKNIVVRNENVVEAAAFTNVTSLQSIVYNLPIIEIKNLAFSYVTGAQASLLTILSSSSLVKIGNSAFSQCQFTESLYLRNNILEIGGYPFLNSGQYTIECQAISKPIGWDSNWDRAKSSPITLHNVTWGVNP